MFCGPTFHTDICCDISCWHDIYVVASKSSGTEVNVGILWHVGWSCSFMSRHAHLYTQLMELFSSYYSHMHDISQNRTPITEKIDYRNMFDTVWWTNDVPVQDMWISSEIQGWLWGCTIDQKCLQCKGRIVHPPCKQYSCLVWGRGKYSDCDLLHGIPWCCPLQHPIER
jgi:hypothetical protein